MKLFTAFADGWATGIDPLGCLLGYVTKRDIFLGHIADKYSLSGHEPYPLPREIKERSLDEKIVKALGDITGLACNVIMLGVPQAGAVIASPLVHYLPRELPEDNYATNGSH